MARQRIVRPLKDRLAEALNMRDMKAIDLSKETGISRGAISQYLAGKVKPKQDKIAKMATALHVSPAWLMGFQVPIVPDKETVNNTDTPDTKNPLTLDKGRPANMFANHLRETATRSRTRIDLSVTLDERDFIEDYRQLPARMRHELATLVELIAYPELNNINARLKMSKTEIKEPLARQSGLLTDEPDDFNPPEDDE